MLEGRKRCQRSTRTGNHRRIMVRDLTSINEARRRKLSQLSGNNIALASKAIGHHGDAATINVISSRGTISCQRALPSRLISASPNSSANCSGTEFDFRLMCESSGAPCRSRPKLTPGPFLALIHPTYRRHFCHSSTFWCLRAMLR